MDAPLKMYALLASVSRTPVGLHRMARGALCRGPPAILEK